MKWRHTFPINLGRVVPCHYQLWKCKTRPQRVMVLYLKGQSVNWKSVTLPRTAWVIMHRTAILLIESELVVPLCRHSFSLFCKVEHHLPMIQLFTLWVILQPKGKLSIANGTIAKTWKWSKDPLTRKWMEKKTAIIT